MTRARLREVENMENVNNINNSNINVVRKHSLKSDSLMSPQLQQSKFQSPRQVKRAASERCTPQTAPYTRYFSPLQCSGFVLERQCSNLEHLLIFLFKRFFII